MMSLFWMSIVVIFFSASFVGNLANIYSFYKFKRLRSNKSYWHVASLSLADIGISLTMILALVNYSWSSTPTIICDVYSCLLFLTGFPPLLIYPITTFDRYLKLTNRQRYDQVVTLRRIITYHVIVWTIPGPIVIILNMTHDHYFPENDCMALMPGYMDPKIYYWAIIIIGHVTIGLFTFFNYKVYRLTLDYQEWLSKVINNRESPNCVPHVKFTIYYQKEILPSTSRYSQRWIVRKILHQVRNQKSLTLCLLFTTIIRLVSIFMSSLWMMRAYFCSDCEPFVTFPTIKFLTPWFYYINCVIDPYLILYMNSDFRTAFRKSSSHPPDISFGVNSEAVFMVVAQMTQVESGGENNV